jgi:hypothetical protein
MYFELKFTKFGFSCSFDFFQLQKDFLYLGYSTAYIVEPTVLTYKYYFTKLGFFLCPSLFFHVSGKELCSGYGKAI